jgi:uncharacterized protein
MIPRTLASKATILLDQYPMLAISGPRQSGKTTLARQLRPEYQYVNLELDENRDFATNDPHGFLQLYKNGVILDEVQYVPTLFPYLKHYTDLRGLSGEYILTGSQHFLLLEKITQSLAGRVGLLRLLPFSMQELDTAGLMPATADEFIYKGAYPRLYDKRIAPVDFYPAYIQTYVERDVRQVVNVGDLRVFRQFLTACAGRAGQLVNFTELGTILGVDSKTVKSWIGILEASFIIFLLPPYHRNFDKRIIKSPKLYFYDTGLVCTLLNITDPAQLQAHFAKGALFENMIVSELVKTRLHAGNDANFYFWQDSNGREIDLLHEVGSALTVIEIKSGKTITKDFMRNLLYFNELANGVRVNAHLIYGGEENQIRSDVQIWGWADTSKVLS